MYGYAQCLSHFILHHKSFTKLQAEVNRRDLSALSHPFDAARIHECSTIIHSINQSINQFIYFGKE
jgi:hypothetical protein